MSDHRTIWVCVDCIMHHANGECGSCYDDSGHYKEPLNRLDCTKVTMGRPWDEHECNKDEDGIEYGYCDCEIITHSMSSCDGCGSDYHGIRRAMTEWT
jgi:hypothetical protein